MLEIKCQCSTILGSTAGVPKLKIFLNYFTVLCGILKYFGVLETTSTYFELLLYFGVLFYLKFAVFPYL